MAMTQMAKAGTNSANTPGTVSFLFVLLVCLFMLCTHFVGLLAHSYTVCRCEHAPITMQCNYNYIAMQSCQRSTLGKEELATIALHPPILVTSKASFIAFLFKHFDLCHVILHTHAHQPSVCSHIH